MLLDLIAVFGGCVFLYIGGNTLLDSAVRIGRSLHWSDAITGLVVVSLGTSAPELFVSTGSALQGFGDIAAGNVVGSNTVNIALVLGLGALLYPLPIDAILRTTQFPLMLLATVLASYLLADGHFTRGEAILLFAVVAAGLAYTFYRLPQSAIEVTMAEQGNSSVGKNALHLAMGVAGLIIGAELLIVGGVGLSRNFGISEAVIALTVTALGTSLPEIAATVMAISRKQGQLAVGNVLGSNVLNIGLVLGVAGTIAPFSTQGLDSFSLGSMLAFALFATMLAFKPGHYPRWSGAILLIAYLVYLTYLFQ